MRTTLLCLGLFSFLAASGQVQASITIDFEVPTGNYGNNTGDLTTVYNAGGFMVTVGPEDGSVTNSGTYASALGSDNFLSSVYAGLDGVNDFSVSLTFSEPIWGMVSFDAAYGDASNGGADFIVKDAANAAVFQLSDGPNSGSFSFNLLSPTTKLTFRDNNQLPVAIDNLVVQPVPEASSLVAWTLLALAGGGWSWRKYAC